MADPVDTDAEREVCERLLRALRNEMGEGTLSAPSAMALVTGIARMVIWQAADSDRVEYFKIVDSLGERLRNVPPWKGRQGDH